MQVRETGEFSLKIMSLHLLTFLQVVIPYASWMPLNARPALRAGAKALCKLGSHPGVLISSYVEWNMSLRRIALDLGRRSGLDNRLQLHTLSPLRRAVGLRLRRGQNSNLGTELRLHPPGQTGSRTGNSLLSNMRLRALLERITPRERWAPAYGCQSSPCAS